MNFLEELSKIERDILAYYEKSFNEEVEEYQQNALVKNKLKELIMNVREDPDKVKETLLVLAKYTGCAEDQEIAEDIIEALQKGNYITNEQIDYFDENASTGRWF
ncbi:hypothetical protein [Tenacibaculum maritimum]|uniref:hypothetical protein n=1 Tax=Tenacibaculum maritimum TaxID=107401 RepID=UPI001E2E2940|nr:hypothetical protein [Tenacibaculum maritimum]MCD9562887.1 hypothetical protein [Tenacibaculum maritimum]MCD9566346.1 hypothetical protein [Tenacibaculum maritimum]MCD9579752.1 hypothetical protein [Tenacibaculum maritimum]MCD9597791.1 hypothetical protein [Tenacibaculum maritimum]MCD9614135.1 hypothetical protein [Tenacibaculum maritimum]